MSCAKTLAAVSAFLLLEMLSSAQCASGKAAVLMPCGSVGSCSRVFYPTPDAAYGTGHKFAEVGKTAYCGYGEDGPCYITYVAAGGTCVGIGLNGPDVMDKLDKLSARTGILVASCDGGLVPFRKEIHAANFNPEKGLDRLDSSLLDKKSTKE